MTPDYSKLGAWPAYVYDRVVGHAKECSPNEACGFVVQYRHFARVMPCRNVSDLPKSYFTIAAEDFKRAEEEYDKILAVFHSHPSTPAHPGNAPLYDGDRAQSELHHLPYLVYSGLTGGWAYYEPSGWVADFVGRSWVPGVFDCWTLVRDYYERKLGIKMGTYIYDTYWYADPSKRLFEENFEREGFVPIHPGRMREHDGILFSFGTPQIAHCGIYLGDGMMLHQREGALSTRELLNEEYRRKIVVGVRHRSMLQPGDDRAIMSGFRS